MGITAFQYPKQLADSSIDQFKRRLNKIFNDLHLGNHIHYRQQKKQFLRNAVVDK